VAGRLEKLKHRADFLRVAAARRSVATPGVVLQAAACPDHDKTGSGIRIGFTASRKVGNAVTRNRAKRRLRAVAAMVLPRRGYPGTDYVLIARAGTPTRPFSDLVGDLESALRRIDGRRRLSAPHETASESH
jgi:ribonuclease P protein component